MKLGFTILLTLTLLACTSEASQKGSVAPISSNTDKQVSIDIDAKKLSFDSDFQTVKFPEVDLPPTPDSSFIYQVVFELQPELYLAIAQPTAADRDGIRLQLITEKKNGKYKLLDSSSPGYDSPMLYPNFFKNDRGQLIIIASTGEAEAWGAKVFYLAGNKFKDIGFIDMASVEKRQFPKEDGSMESYGHIANYTQINSVNDQLNFTFNGDKMILFEGLDKEYDVIFSSGEYLYTFDGKELVLGKK